MNDMQTAVRGFIDRCLRSMVESPRAWGANETVELEVLLLLEVRALVLCPHLAPRDLCWIQDGYVRFLSERFPDSPPVPLARRLGPDQSDQFAPIIDQFIRSVVDRQDTGAAPDRSRTRTGGEGPIAAALRTRGRTPRQRPAAPFLDLDAEAA